MAVSEDPLEEVRLLEAACKRIADELDLDMVQFALLPGKPDKVALTLGLKPDSARTASEKEQANFDDAFADIMGDMSFDGEHIVETEKEERYSSDDFKEWFK